MRSFNASNIPHALSNPLYRAVWNDSEHPVLEDCASLGVR